MSCYYLFKIWGGGCVCENVSFGICVVVLWYIIIYICLCLYIDVVDG